MRLVRPQAGVGLLVNNEIFRFGGQYLEDFGIWLKPAKRRVVFIVEVAGAEMDSARAGVFFPGRTAIV